ncbi:MAG TPA: hypothetical protein VNZ53_31350 [Steroidobacteraceae bacterium]|nr:hypothetical protein [Steroidobacteraceae bacterium]
MRGILRIAPDWALKVMDAAPDEFFMKIDHLLMPLEIGSISSGRLCESQPHIRSNTYLEVAAHLETTNISPIDKQKIEELFRQ